MNLAAIKSFTPIDLVGINQVQLMRRIDRKFLIPAPMISDIFEAISDDYFVLEINEERLHGYQTVYFDTSDNHLYKCHHNGKLNRYKIRKRIYLETQASFLEIKFKNNKGKTLKERIPSTNNLFGFTEEELEYLNTRIPFDANLLIPRISNRFHRITLASRDFSERCTIDFDIDFSANGKHRSFGNLIVIEVKQDKAQANSMLIKTLNKHRVKASGFSKYCMGRVLTDDELKQNAFKDKLRKVYKLTS